MDVITDIIDVLKDRDMLKYVDYYKLYADVYKLLKE